MATDKLDLGVSQPLTRQMGQDLMPQEMGMDVLLDPGLPLELLDQLLDSASIRNDLCFPYPL